MHLAKKEREKESYQFFERKIKTRTFKNEGRERVCV